jgi:carboxymethylenebutenolidase
MPRLTASDFPREVLTLFDQYVHGGISRREFLDNAGRHAVGGMSAAGLLAALSPDFASAQQVAPGDSRIATTFVDFDSPKGYGKARGYLAKPQGAAGKLPAVLVCHENRGLNPHIEDIARRLALEGYLAFAPDALFSLGGYPGDEDKARDLFAKLDQGKVQADFLAATAVLKARADVNGRVGTVGFCWGGGMVNYLATQWPDLAAGVPFYGMAPALQDVPRIKAPLLLHFAANDERIDAAWPPYEAALKKAGVRYEAFIYPGTEHGFNNDTTPRFDAKAAGLAWARTLAFFKTNLHVAA